MPANDQPLVIRDFGGVNRRDGGERVPNNEFFRLQNVVHTTKGLLYKRPGTTAELTSGNLYGAAEVTGLYRHRDAFGNRFTLYSCRPDVAVPLPQPSTDLGLAEINGGDLFKGAAVEVMRFCYTWIGMGMESNYNSISRMGFTALTTTSIHAYQQGGHQSITVSSNVKGVRVTAPNSFPSGVTGLNVFAARGTSTDMAYVGSILSPSGTLDVTHFTATTAALSDSVPIITVYNNPINGGSLKPGRYYIAAAWACSGPKEASNMNIYGGTPYGYVKLSDPVAVDVTPGQRAIAFDVSGEPSTNGATYAYVFISTKPFDEVPGTCLAIVKADATVRAIVSITEGLNAQTIPFHDGTAITHYFDHSTRPANAQNTDRFGFILKKTSSGTVSTLFMSRSELGWRYSIGATVVDPFTKTALASAIQGTHSRLGMIATATDKITQHYLANDYGSSSAFAYSTYLGTKYKAFDPTFCSTQGLVFMANGINLLISTDGIAMASMTEEAGTVLPPVPAFVIVFQNGLIAAGSNCGPQTYGSNALKPRNWVSGGTGTSLRFQTIGDGFGDSVTALGLYSFQNVDDGPTIKFVVMKANGAWTSGSFPDPASGIPPSLQQIHGKVGCIAYRSLKSTPIGPMFLGTDGDMYLISGGGQMLRIAPKIKPVFSHLVSNPDLMRKVTACFHQDFYKLSYPVASTSTYNDAQWYADLRTQDGPITWSGPHIGAAVGAQITLDGEEENGSRIGARADAVGSLLLDDTSTFQDLGTAIDSVIESKTFRFLAEMHFKRYMGMELDIYFDSQFSHSLLLECFADFDYKSVTKVLSTGGGTWDVDDFDSSALWSDAVFQCIPMLFDDNNLVGRTFKFQLTHSDNAQFILAAAAIIYRPERRQVA